MKTIHLIHIYNRILEKIHPLPKILSNEKTIEELAINHKSLGRFGDGELMLILQTADISFQICNPELSKKLEMVLKSHDEGFLVGIPQVFSKSDLKKRNNDSILFWRNNLLDTRHEWYKRIDFSRTYANSTFTRNYLTLKDKGNSMSYFEKVKSIWNGRKVLVIEGEKSRVGVGNNLFSNTLKVKRILCPVKNAFSVYSDILTAALQISTDYLILIALGPTATILAFDLYHKGYQAIDIGHIDIEFEWFLHNSQTKEAISGKWVAEGAGMKDDSLINDDEYQKSIIKIIH